MPTVAIPHKTLAVTLDALMGSREDDLAARWASIIDAQSPADPIQVEACEQDIAIAIEVLRQVAETVVEDPSDFCHEPEAYISAADAWSRCSTTQA